MMPNSSAHFSSTATSSLPLNISISRETEAFDCVFGKYSRRNVPKYTAVVDAPLREVGRASSDAIPAAIAANLMEITRAGISAPLFERLVRLAQSAESGAMKEKLPMSSRSLQSFLTFWAHTRKDAVEPDVFLLPNGNVQAEWAKKCNLMTIEFRDDGEMFFSIVDESGEMVGKERATPGGEMLSLLLARKSKPLYWAP